MIRQWQELFYDNRLSGADLDGNPDFVKLAEAYGIKAFRIKRAGRRRPHPAQGARPTTTGPCVVEAEVVKEDNVFPMIPAGAARARHDHRAAEAQARQADGEHLMSRRTAAAPRRRADRHPHDLGAREQQARRARARRARVRAPRLQHREPGGEPGRRGPLLAHDDHLLAAQADDLEQIIKQVTKLIDVVHAIDHTGRLDLLEIEIALIKLECALDERTPDPADRRALQGARWSTSARTSLILQAHGSSEKLDALIELLRPFRSSSWCARASS